LVNIFSGGASGRRSSFFTGTFQGRNFMRVIVAALSCAAIFGFATAAYADDSVVS
jgi:hypothetical protein